MFGWLLLFDYIPPSDLGVIRQQGFGSENLGFRVTRDRDGMEMDCIISRPSLNPFLNHREISRGFWRHLALDGVFPDTSYTRWALTSYKWSYNPL